MNPKLPSLITTDAQTGITLATDLARELQSQIEHKPERPGGMNYSVQPMVSPELMGSILFFAIAAANQGWPPKNKLT